MKARLLFTIASSMVFAISVFAQQPTAYASFPFDEDFTDVMGAVIAVPGGDVAIVTDDERGGVASFPGGAATDPHYIDLSDAAWGLPAVTYCMWFKLNSVDMWARLLEIGTQDQGATANEVWMTVANGRHGGALGFTVDLDFSGGPEIIWEVPVIDTWYHVCAGLDATDGILWVNGVIVADSLHPMGNPAAAMCPDIYIGKAVWGDPLLNGFIDDFKIYDHLLNDEEVEDIYNAVSVKPVRTPAEPTVYTYNGRIYIRDAENFNIHSVKIYNMAGQLVCQVKDHFSFIDANLPTSLYIVSIDSEQGSFKRKVVLQ